MKLTWENIRYIIRNKIPYWTPAEACFYLGRDETSRYYNRIFRCEFTNELYSFVWMEDIVGFFGVVGHIWVIQWQLLGWEDSA